MSKVRTEKLKAFATCAMVALGLASASQNAEAADRFHDVLLDGPGVTISNPMLIVGLEKASKRRIGAVETDLVGCGDDTRCLHLRGASGPGQIASAALIERRKRDKPLFVSHIVDLPGATAVDVVYSAYDSEGRLKQGALADRSWAALENDLRDAITRRLDDACRTKCPTHIVLLSTGWRTPQRTSIKRYQEWARGIEQELDQKGADVAPMFVGITWPSAWRLPTLSFLNKAHDADEAGYIWGAVLLHRVLAPIATSRDIQLVLVGHSFGARLLTSAVAGRPFVMDGDCRQTEPRISMIGLEAAFSTGRFNGLGKEGGPYQDLAACGGRFAFVASRHDEGVRLAPMELVSHATAYIGGGKGLTMIKASPLVFQEASASARGDLSELWSPSEPRRILVIDGSEGVKCHNDVYDQFATRLIANLIVGEPSGRPDLPPQDDVCPG